MAKSLIITEKPSVARDIVKALGGFTEQKDGAFFESDTYVCSFAVGHILSLFAPEDIKPEYKRWRLQDLPIIPEKFATKPVDSQKSRLKVLKKLLERKDVDCVINACDAAREGELIFREILSHYEITKPVKRLWLQSMTQKAIRDGFASLQDGEKFEPLGVAAECRAHADWLIGMNATRALTVRLKSRNQRGLSWSAGRVQTPTLSLLVERELEILEHHYEPYWRIKGQFKAGAHSYEGIWFDPQFKTTKNDRKFKEDRIFDKERMETILKAVQGNASAQAKEVRKPSPRKAPHLFDLTSLQRTANTRFGWPASRTLKAAQRCYEAHKVLTYPRTSSKVLPENYRTEVDRIFDQLSQSREFKPHVEYLSHHGRLNEDKIFDDKGVTDHFAIIPTGELRELSGDDAKLFDLVTRQTIAAFYPPSVYEDVTRITTVAEQSFKSKPAKVLKEAGWEAVFGKVVGEGEENFPPLVPGENNPENITVATEGANSEELETKPPQRISEAKLLSLMEHAGRAIEDEELATALRAAEGLGTAATRADIIENLKTREYVDSSLRPTVKGIRLIDILKRIGASRLTSAQLTGMLELHLNEVEQGKRNRQDFMKEIETYAQEVVEAARAFSYDEIYPDEDSLGQCPKCQSPVYERAWFYACTKATDANKSCRFLIWKDHYSRYINRSVIKTLLTDQITRELDGFRSMNGQTYKAILSLENGNLERKSTQMGDGEALNIDETPLGACKIHLQDCQVIETGYEFICETKKTAKADGDHQAPGISIPRMLCKREISREEAQDLIYKGATDYLTNFISKRNRKFSARLVFDNESGGFQFEFPQRTKKTASKDKEQNSDQKADSAAQPSPS